MIESTEKGQPNSGLALLSWTLLLAILLAFAPAAQAQPKDGDLFEEWGVRCRDNPQAGLSQVCTIEHAAYNSKSKKRVVGIRVGYPPDGTTPQAIIVVPLLVIIQAGLKVQIDDGEAMSLPFEFCSPNGCQVSFELKPKLLEALKAGQGGTVFFRVIPGRELSVPFSLKGFPAALAALK